MKKNTKVSIARLLVKIRKAMKWSQEDLGRELGACLGSIRNWEKGSEPSEIWDEKIRRFHSELIVGEKPEVKNVKTI